MALIDTLLIFAVGLLIGGLGIYTGSRLTGNANSYSYAIGTAFIGALIWAVVSFFIGGIPAIGPLLSFIAWLWIIKIRYSEGWLTAGLIALFSWVTVLIVLSILASLGVTGFDAIGIPL